MRHPWKAALGLLIGVSLAGGPVCAQDPAPAIRATMGVAGDLLLNLDADRAEVECSRLLALPEGEAAGRFCLGVTALTRAGEMDDPDPDLDRFLDQVARAIAAGQRLEQTRPADPEVKLLLGLSHGSQALVQSGRGHYVAAWQALRDGLRCFQEALALDPSLTDAYYGIGLYDYALGRLPGLLRPAVGLVLARGDATQGLQELERVAEGGAYLKMTARLALLELYAGQEHRYTEALRLGRDLLGRYPGNPDVYFATASAASELGRFPEALAIARRAGENIAAGAPHFPPALRSRYEQLLGKIYMDQGEYAAALRFFQQAVETPTPPRYRWVTAWAWTRSGMIFDLEGDRAEAERRYREALAIPTDAPAKDVARQYLENPYRGRPGSARLPTR